MTDFLSCLPRAKKKSSLHERAVFETPVNGLAPHVNVNEQTDSLFGNEKLGERSTSPPRTASGGLSLLEPGRWSYHSISKAYFIGMFRVYHTSIELCTK